MYTPVYTVCAEFLLLAVYVNQPGEIDCNIGGQALQNRDPGREGSVAEGGEGRGRVGPRV